jgi:hypothetical protein
MLYDIDSNSKIGLRLAAKLTRKQVDLPSFSLMKVSRAAQVFSYTVSSAMTNYACAGQLPIEALHTANFIRQVDQLFDCFISSSIRNSKLFCRSIRERSPCWDILQRCREMPSKLEVVNSSGRVVNCTGWQQNISALKVLFDELRNQPLPISRQLNIY